MENERDYSWIEIDKNRLDREWLNQPKLYLEYSDKLAIARRKLDEAESELKVVECDLYRAVRKNPSKFGLDDKPTESSITKTIPSQKEYKEAVEFVNSRKYKVNLLQGVVIALDHRKRALQNLVMLLGQQYFSPPTALNEEDRITMGNIKKDSIRRKTKH